MESNRCDFLSRPGNNEAPSEEELERIRTLRQECNAGINAIDRQIKELITQRKYLVNDLTKYDSLLSPIRRIPVEILSKIFHHATVIPSKALPQPTVIASTVCQAWRKLAIDTPTLWTNIAILIPPHPRFKNPFNEVRSPDVIEEEERIWKRLAEGLLAITPLWIDRSKECPLSLTIRFNTVSVTKRMSWQDTSAVALPLYRALVDLACSVAHRWREVDLDIMTRNQPLVQSILSLESHHVPQLESISFPSIDVHKAGGPPFFPSGLLGAPSLRSVFLLHLDRPWTQLPINWNCLTKLRFGVRTDGLEVGAVPRSDAVKRLGPLGALSLFQACPNLEECELALQLSDQDDRDRKPLGSAVERDRVLRMAHMRSLTFHEFGPMEGFTQMLQLPSLQQLHSVGSCVGEWGKSMRSTSTSHFLHAVGRFGALLTDTRFSLLLLEDTNCVIPCFKALPNLLSLQLDSSVLDVEYFRKRAQESLERSAKLLLTLLTPVMAQGGVIVTTGMCLKLKRFACTLHVKAFTEDQLVEFIISRSGLSNANIGLAKIEEVDVAFGIDQGMNIRSELEKRGIDVGSMNLRIQYRDTTRRVRNSSLRD